MKNRKNVKKSTMTLHLWFDFVMFAVIIMIILWLLQVIFLNAFYESMKKSEIEKIGDEMVELYKKDSGEFSSYLENRSFKRGVFAHLLDEEGNIVTSPQPMEEFRRTPDERPAPPISMQAHATDFNSDTWDKFVKKVSDSNDKTAAYVITMPPNSRMMIYGALLKSTDGKISYLYITSPLQPIDATRRVLQNQLIIVSVISVVLSVVLAYFIAKRFSKPIIRASKQAEKLASGRYDVHFEDGSYREISQLNEVLNKAAKELKKIERLRMDLMANVSHDLKTPLTIIKSYAEMILDISGEDREKRNAHTKVIIDETNRLSSLVNDILNLSKLQSGVATPEFTEFCLSDIIKSAIEKFLVYSEKYGYTILSDIDEEIYISADKGQIMQAVYNLISNAVNYTGEEGKISILLKSDGALGKVRFSVEDFGEGISDDELAYVWERYYRTGKSHVREVAGTGIGLSIVKQVFESHGFSYGVDSKKGVGSVFWFEAPEVNN